MKTYVVYGEKAPVFCIDVPDNFFLTHDRFNGWISCFDSEREGHDGIVNKTKQRGVFSVISQCELFS